MRKWGSFLNWLLKKDCTFKIDLIYYNSFPAKSGWGHDPLDPLLPAPQEKESKLSSEWVVSICLAIALCMYLWVSPVRGPGEYMKKRVGKRY